MLMLDGNAPGHSADELDFYLHLANINEVVSNILLYYTCVVRHETLWTVP